MLRSRFKLALILLLLIALAGAVVVRLQRDRINDALRQRAIQEVEKRFPVRMELERLDFNPLLGTIEITNLQLSSVEFPQPEPAISIRRIHLQLSLTRPRFPFVNLDEVELEAPQIRVIEDSNNRINISNMFLAPQPSAQGSPRGLAGFIQLSIGRIRLDRGLIVYRDQPFDLESAEGGLQVEMNFLRGLGRYQGEAIISDAQLKAGPVQLSQLDTKLDFELLPDAIRLPSVSFRTPAVEGQLWGAIDRLHGFQYRFDTDLVIHPARLEQPPLNRFVDSGQIRSLGVFTGEGGEFRYASRLSSDQIQIRQLEFSEFSSTIEVDRNGVQTDQLHTRFLDGEVEATGQLRWSADAASRFDIRAIGLSLRKGLKFMQTERFGVSGTAGFVGTATWPGTEFSDIQGSGKLDYRGQYQWGAINQNPPAFAFFGSAPILFDTTQASFVDGRLETLGIPLLFDGNFVYKGEAAFQFEGFSETTPPLVETALELGWLPAELLARFPISLGGTFFVDAEFEAKPGADLQVRGSATQASLLLYGQPLGAATAVFDLSQSCLCFPHLQLERPGSTLEGELALRPEDDEYSGLSYSFQLENWPLEELLSLSGNELDLEGQLSGVIQKAPDSSLVGQLRVPRALLWQEELLDLRADFELSDQRLTLKQVSGRAADGTLSGNGFLVRETEEFLARLDAFSISIPQLHFLKERIPIAAIADVTLTAKGVLQNPEWEAIIESPDLRVSDFELGAVRLSVQGDPLNWRDAGFRAEAKVDGRPYTAEGKIAVTEELPVSATLQLDQLPLTPYLDFGEEAGDLDLTGFVSAQVILEGPLASLDQLELKADLTSVEVSSPNYELRNQGPIRLAYSNSLLTLLPASMVGTDTQLQLEGSLQFGESRTVELRTKGQLNLRVLEPFLDEGAASGRVDLETVIAGSLESPRFIGTAQLDRVFLRHPQVPVTIQEATGQLRFTSGQVSIDDIQIRTRWGTLIAEGGVFLDGWKPDRWRVNAYGYGLQFEYPRNVRSSLDVDLDFIRSPGSNLVTGDVWVRSTEYSENVTLAELILRNTGTGISAPAAGSEGEEIDLDVAVQAFRTLEIDNNLARLTASASVRVKGTLQNPIILGGITVDEGQLFFDDEEYDLVRGQISFNDPVETRPVLSFEASTEVRDYSITVLVNGPLDQLRATFISDPPLPTASIVSLIAVGQTQEEIFGYEGRGQADSGSLAIYGAGAILSKGLGEQLSRQSSRLFGLDRFNVDPFFTGNESSPAARVSVGKKINRNLSVTYTTLLGGETLGQTVIIEYKLTNWLTAVGTGDLNGELALDFKFRKRF